MRAVTACVVGWCAVWLIAADLRASEAPRAAFRFLRVGEVQPRGWLLDQIRMDATNGYGAVLEALTERIRIGEFDSRHKAALAQPKIGADWWNGETTGNWLDGFVRTAYLSGDAPAKRRADELVAKIMAMCDEDGYLGIYPRTMRYESPIGVQNGELWTQACLFRGLLAYYELTGRADVLNAVSRAAELTVSRYGPGRPYWRAEIGGDGPGHDIMFADVCEWLGRLTGEARYAAFAKFLYDGYCAAARARDDDAQLRNLSDPSKPFRGHGAHVMEHLRVPLFVAYSAGDQAVFKAVGNLLPKIERHLAAGGACISDENVGGREGSPTIGCEYCAALELLHTLQSGVEKTASVRMADAIEVLAFNSAEGARQRDGRAIQYCTSDNQVAITAKAMGGRQKLSPTHEDVAVCCPVTALKFFPYFVSELWMKGAADDALAAVAYAPCSLSTAVRGVAVRIESDTAYPFEDEVRLTLAPERPVTFRLLLRAPAWPGAMAVEAPGAEVAESAGWRALAKEWRAGDRVTITFRPEVVRRAMPNGEAYWARGPLVYALPIATERQAVKRYPVAGFADYTCAPAAGAEWDYAVEEPGCAFAFARREEAGCPWAEPPVRLSGALLNRRTGRSERLELVPMGSSLLRRVTFPSAEAARQREAADQLLKGQKNLARRARATASSSARGYAAQAVADGVAEGFPDNASAEWASQREGAGAKVRLEWDAPVAVACVWLFDRRNEADHVTGVAMTFSDGSRVEAGALPNDGQEPLKVAFPQRDVTWVEITVTKAGVSNKNAGFSEIAVFEGP